VGWIVGWEEGCIVGCPEGLFAAGDKVGDKEIEGAAVVGLEVDVEGATVVGLEVFVGTTVGAVVGAGVGFEDARLGLDEG